MDFDIHKLDALDADRWDRQLDRTFERYKETLLKLFSESREGKAYLKSFPDGLFWVDAFVHFGYAYLGVPLTKMRVSDVEEVVLGMFPRKVAVDVAEAEREAIPGLVAFWEYLKREYNLPAADKILDRLRNIKREFKEAMEDTSLFGPAKSLFALGEEAGFDMTDQDELQRFIEAFNLFQMLDQEEKGKGSRNRPRRKRKSTKARKKRKK